MDKQYISIIILFIFMIYLYNNNYKNNLIIKNYNKDNFTNHFGITGLIIEIGKLSEEILNSIQNNTIMTFNNNVKIFGNSNLVPLKSIIIWTRLEPPYPNTNPITINDNGYELSYTLSDTDCWYPCIGGTINVDGDSIDIPDMRGRMIVGYGATDDHPSDLHRFIYNPGERVGGNIPLKNHKHDGETGDNEGAHKHNIPINDDIGQNDIPKSFVGNRNSSGGISNRVENKQYKLVTVDNDTNSNHKHFGDEARTDNTKHNYGTNYYSRNVIPHSTILQFWMRVR